VGSGVNGLTLGSLRLLGRLSSAGQGPAVGDRVFLYPTMVSLAIRQCAWRIIFLVGRLA
jgi:hypothetical protein